MVTLVQIQYLPLLINKRAFIKGIRRITLGNLIIGRYTLRKFLEKHFFEPKSPQRKTTFLRGCRKAEKPNELNHLSNLRKVNQ
jgi:hypothetical protein